MNIARHDFVSKSLPRASYAVTVKKVRVCIDAHPGTGLEAVNSPVTRVSIRDERRCADRRTVVADAGGPPAWGRIPGVAFFLALRHNSIFE
jgi:hypothetical protein